jgi:hypothetical protein
MRGIVLTALLLGMAGVGSDDALAKDPKPKRPKIEARGIPALGVAPLDVLVVLDLKGGDEIEELYCPEVEFNWADGSKSVQESDCPPFVPGQTTLTRRFSARHTFRGGGEFNVRVRLRRADKIVASAETRVSVRGGFDSLE